MVTCSCKSYGKDSSGSNLASSIEEKSADFFLGVPFNIASTALLLHIVARFTGFKPKWVNITFNDAHIYVNHLDQVKEQLSREHRPLPRLAVNTQVPSFGSMVHQTEQQLDTTLRESEREVRECVAAKATFALGQLKPEWFQLSDYDPHPPIKAPMAV